MVVIDADLEERFRMLYNIYISGSPEEYQEFLAIYELLLKQRGLL